MLDRGSAGIVDRSGVELGPFSKFSIIAKLFWTMVVV